MVEPVDVLSEEPLLHRCTCLLSFSFSAGLHANALCRASAGILCGGARALGETVARVSLPQLLVSSCSPWRWRRLRVLVPCHRYSRVLPWFALSLVALLES